MDTPSTQPPKTPSVRGAALLAGLVVGGVTVAGIFHTHDRIFQQEGSLVAGAMHQAIRSGVPVTDSQRAVHEGIEVRLSEIRATNTDVDAEALGRAKGAAGYRQGKWTIEELEAGGAFLLAQDEGVRQLALIHNASLNIHGLSFEQASRTTYALMGAAVLPEQERAAMVGALSRASGDKIPTDKMAALLEATAEMARPTGFAGKTREDVVKALPVIHDRIFDALGVDPAVRSQVVGDSGRIVAGGPPQPGRVAVAFAGIHKPLAPIGGMPTVPSESRHLFQLDAPAPQTPAARPRARDTGEAR